MNVRSATESEHELIEMQLKQAVKRHFKGACLLGWMLMAETALTISIIKWWEKNIITIIMLLLLISVIIISSFIIMDELVPSIRIPKKQYVILDCVVTDVIRKNCSTGKYHYWATVSYEDETTQKVNIAVDEIAERLRIGEPAIVVFFFNINGQRRKRAYSLCLTS